MEEKQGNIKISSENMMPIIKKWLYSDKDIFLRELVVTLRQAIPYKPTMIVVKKETKIISPRKSAGIEGFTGGKEDCLKGIKCRWFTSTGELQEAVFNTKDLIKL